MKTVSLYCICFLALTMSCRNSEPFIFVQMSDPQIGFLDESPAYAHSDSLLKAAVDGVNELDPAFVFVTGDLVNDPSDPVQDSIYRVRMSEIKAPVYAVLGNHDCLGIPSPEYERFSFQAKDCAFIGIVFNIAGPVGHPLGHGTSGYNVVKVSADGFTINYVETRD